MTVRANRGFTFIDDAWTAAGPPVIKLPGRSRISSIPGHPTPDGTGLKHLRLALILLLPLLLVISVTAPLQAGPDDSPKFKGDIPIAAGPQAEPAQPQLPTAIRGTEEEKWALPIFQELFYSGSQNFICGRLTGPDGLPASHIGVILCDWSGYYVYPSRFTSTDDDGFYFFTRIRTGKYFLFFSTNAANIAYQKNLASTYYSSSLPISNGYGDLITIGSKTIMTGLDMQLLPGASLTGRVTNTKDEPLAGIEVYIWFNELSSYSSFTGADGSFTLNHLPSGAGNFSCKDPSYIYMAKSIGKVTIEPSDNSPVDVQLMKYSHIEGRVVDSREEGIEGVSIQIISKSNSSTTHCSTGPEGYYRSPNLDPGEYRIFFQSILAGVTFKEYYQDKAEWEQADLVEVLPDTTVTGIDARMNDTGQIEGWFSYSVPGLTVRLFGSSGDEVWQHTMGDPKGFRSPMLPAGEYKVYFDASGLSDAVSVWYPDEPDMDHAGPVTIEPGKITSLGTIETTILSGGRIAGRVTDESGNGIPGIAVALSLFSPPVAITGPGGEYVTQKIRPGKRRVVFSPAGQSNWQIQWYPGQLKETDGQHITVLMDQTTAGIDAVLLPGGTVEGRLTGAAGEPLAGASVTARPDDWTMPSLQSHTLDDGRYTLPGLSPVNYRLLFSMASPYETSWYNRKDQEHADLIMVQPGQTMRDADMWLDRSGSIQGRVTGPDGQSVEGVHIAGHEIQSGGHLETYTGSDGTYTLLLPPGQWRLHFADYSAAGLAPEWYPGSARKENARVFPVTLNLDHAGIDVRLKAGGKITGKVAWPEDTEPAKIDLCLYQNGEITGGFQVHPPGYNKINQKVTAEFEIARILPGEYKLKASGYNLLPEWYSQQESELLAQPVLVQEGTTTGGIDFLNLREKSCLAGIILDQEQLPVGDQPVELYNAQFQRVNYQQSDTSGSFRFNGHDPGTYYLKAGGANGYDEQWYSGQTSMDGATPIQLQAGELLRNLVVILQEQGGRITGQVTTYWGEPLSSVMIIATHEETGESFSCYSLPSGFYRLRQLPPGHYRVFFSGYQDHALPQWYNGKEDEASADLVLVLPNMATHGVSAQLRTHGFVEGRVINEQDQPMRSIQVILLDSAGKQISADQTDFSGRFRFAQIPDGDYLLEFSGGTNYMTQWWQNASSLQQATPIKVRANQYAGFFEVRMVLQGRIKGTVRNEAGDPVADVKVIARTSSGAPAGYTTTDAQGQYTMYSTENGNILLQFRHSKYCSEYYQKQWTVEGAVPIPIGPAAVVEGVDAVLTRRGSIQGRLLNSANEPCVDVWVHLYSYNDERWIMKQKTVAGGIFIFPVLDHGDYQMWVQGSDFPMYLDTWYPGVLDSGAARTVRLKPGEDLQESNITLLDYFPPQVPVPSAPQFVLSGQGYCISWPNICPDGWYHVREAETPSLADPEPFVVEGTKFWASHRTEKVATYYYQVRSVRNHYGYSYSPWSGLMEVTVLPGTLADADMNQDQQLDERDLLLLSLSLAESSMLPGRGDLDRNGRVDILDWYYLALVLADSTSAAEIRNGSKGILKPDVH